ncbi:MAG TPA: hypothetical protein VHL11_15110 [Phototrophicaceae bacterium]|nr:hypothetical protein [Phototrophicaceae bacterium]
MSVLASNSRIGAPIFTSEDVSKRYGDFRMFSIRNISAIHRETI